MSQPEEKPEPVSTLAVEWIEMSEEDWWSDDCVVSTLAVEWIEMASSPLV